MCEELVHPRNIYATFWRGQGYQWQSNVIMALYGVEVVMPITMSCADHELPGGTLRSFKETKTRGLAN